LVVPVVPVALVALTVAADFVGAAGLAAGLDFDLGI